MSWNIDKMLARYNISLFPKNEANPSNRLGGVHWQTNRRRTYRCYNIDDIYLENPCILYFYMCVCELYNSMFPTSNVSLHSAEWLYIYNLKCSPWRRKYRHLYPTRYIHPRILRNIHPWRIAYDTSHLIRNINQLFWYFAIQPASLWRNWVILMHASMSGVGNIVLFTSITHIWVIYT